MRATFRYVNININVILDRVALFVPSTSGAFLFENPFHKHNEALV